VQLLLGVDLIHFVPRHREALSIEAKFIPISLLRLLTRSENFDLGIAERYLSAATTFIPISAHSPFVHWVIDSCSVCFDRADRRPTCAFSGTPLLARPSATPS
jgi:hypothetical protein